MIVLRPNGRYAYIYDLITTHCGDPKEIREHLSQYVVHLEDCLWANDSGPSTIEIGDLDWQWDEITQILCTALELYYTTSLL
jgi:hypothetical protein